MKIINWGYLGLEIRLSIKAKNAYLGKFVVKKVESMLQDSLVKVMFLLFKNIIISGSFYSKI